MADPEELPDATESTAITLPTTQSTSTTTGTKKRRKNRNPKPHILYQQTLRSPTWSYIHLSHLTGSSPQSPDLDAVTAHLHLTTAFKQFLGLHGVAIPFDILKLEKQDLWIRVQAEDVKAVVAAAGGWVSGKGEGWRVVNWSSWDAGGGEGTNGGQDLFND